MISWICRTSNPAASSRHNLRRTISIHSAAQYKILLAAALIFDVSGAWLPSTILAADIQHAVIVAPAKISVLVTTRGPFSSGKGEIPIQILETTGKFDANNISVVVEPPLTGKNRPLELKNAISVSPTPLTTIQKGQALTVKLVIEPAETGTATTKITFRTPTQESPVSTIVEVSVRDPWWAALIPIFIGTVLSYWAYRWRSSKRNLLVLKIRAGRLEQEAKSLEQRRPDLKERLQEVYRLIRDVLLEVEVESEAQANTFIARAQTKLDELARTAVPAMGTAAAGISCWKRVWQRLQDIINPQTEETLLLSLRIKTVFRGTVVVLVVTLLGLMVVYDDKAFGGWDYITAILYGFGLDQGLKGLSQITDKI